MTAVAKIQKTVEAALAEWERLKLRARKYELQRDNDLAVQRTKFDKACEPINLEAKHNLDPLYTKMRTLETSIVNELKAGISPDGRTVAVAQVDVGQAVARMKDNGRREIDPAEFFKQVRQADRDQSFWACMQILIGKAEKFLPEAVMERVARHEPKYSVVIELKK